MKPLFELLPQPQLAKPAKRGPNSERAYWLQTVIDELGFDQADFRKLMGQTRTLTVREVEDIFLKAKQWQKNPRALFWKLLKEKRLEIKQRFNL